MPEQSPSPFLTTDQAATRISLKKNTMKKMRIRGDGPPYLVISKRSVLYDAAKLDAWVRSREFHSTSEYDAVAA